MPTRSGIGIVGGSGPEAGADLLTKVFAAHRQAVGPAYRGDIDAPRVHLVSEPELGHSMELATHHAGVRAALVEAVGQLAGGNMSVVGIACNTLNVFVPELRTRFPACTIASMPEVAADRARAMGARRVALLGAAPVVQLGAESAYRGLVEEFDLVTPEDPDPLHELIYDIKQRGGSDAELVARFDAIVAPLAADVVLLACTELPLLELGPDVATIDVTVALADALVRAYRDEITRAD